MSKIGRSVEKPPVGHSWDSKFQKITTHSHNSLEPCAFSAIVPRLSHGFLGHSDVFVIIRNIHIELLIIHLIHARIEFPSTRNRFLLREQNADH